MNELEHLIAQYHKGERACLTDIKTLWLNTEPHPEGTWERFCTTRLQKSARQINRLIAGTTGNEARNVNGKTSDVSLLQTNESPSDDPPDIPLPRDVPGQPHTDLSQVAAAPTWTPVSPTKREMRAWVNTYLTWDPTARVQARGIIRHLPDDKGPPT